MFAAGYQMQGNNVATDFLEKILSRKCKIHQKLPCEYIYLRPSEFSPRLCCKCMEVRKIPLNDAISIRLLLEATSDTTFNAYPKFSDNSITEKIQDLKDNNSNDRIETDLQSFFKNLNSTVSQAIEKVKYEQKQKLSSLSNSYQDVLNSLAKISQVAQFQDLVKNKNENEDQLRAFIQQQDSQVNNYTGIMKNKLLEYQKIEQTFSLSDANNRFKQIILLIEGITLFPSIESNQQQQQQPLFQQQNHTQQPVHEQCIQKKQQPQQQEQLQQQQQLKQQEQKIQQLRKKEQQQNASSQRSDYDYYDSLREQVKNKLRELELFLRSRLEERSERDLLRRSEGRGSCMINKNGRHQTNRIDKMLLVDQRNIQIEEESKIIITTLSYYVLKESSTQQEILFMLQLYLNQSFYQIKKSFPQKIIIPFNPLLFQ